MDDSPEVLQELLEKIAEKHEFSYYDMKIKPLSSGGANFTSQLFSATISNDSKRLDLFAKAMIWSEKFRSEWKHNFFETEYFIYTDISKIYHQIEEKHNVLEEHRLQFPKLYDHNPILGRQVLVLEDLSAQGYCVSDRFKSIDWPYASKAVNEMAKLHALSFAFEQEYPDKFAKTVERFQFPSMSQENLRDVIVNAFETAYNTVNNEQNKHRLQVFFAKTDFLVHLAEYTKPLRRAVLIHGDFRMSNLMYKVDEESNYQLKILDYQTIRASSPVVDLVYFIITGTDEEFRAKHFYPLLDYYYSKLCLAMRRLGLKPGEIYSREDFDFEIKMKLPPGLVIAIFLLPTVLVEEEDAPKIDEEDDFNALHISKVGKLYPERINGIVNDYVKWQIL